MNNYTIVKNEINKDNNITLEINSWYDNSNTCGYVLPVPMSDPMNYKIVNEVVDDPKTKFYNINY